MSNKPTISLSQQGFTLIELMIAITLGLLISAAALMIFLSSQRSLALQGGMSEIQQNTILELRALTYDLRHTNLDTSQAGLVSLNEIGSGIVFNQSQISTDLKGKVTDTNGKAGVMNTSSDRLTIQFTARTAMTDCEGVAIPAGTLVAQHYYIDELPNNQQPNNVTTENRRYGLWCDAIWSGNSTNGRVAITDVDSFKVSLGTRDQKGTLSSRKDDGIRYQKLGEYINSPTGDLVVSIEIGVLMRSSSSVHRDKNIKADEEYEIAGQKVKLANPPATANYLRVPLTQVIAIRNSQGV